MAQMGLELSVSSSEVHAALKRLVLSKLVSSEVKTIIETSLYEKLGRYFEETPQIARRIVEKAILAAKAREAAGQSLDLRKMVLPSYVTVVNPEQ